MAAAFGDDTVWIGFMDIVPVIGSVKEAVELVLALYEGNKEVIKEKEKALENIGKQSLKTHLKGMTVKPAPAAGVDDFSGLRNVTQVSKQSVNEHVKKGSNRGTKPLSPEQKEARLEAIKKQMLVKIQIIDPKFRFELKEQLERSCRGEHVFNNDILRFHSKVLDDFVQEHLIDNLARYNRGAIDAFRGHRLPPNTVQDIQTNMVVHFDKKEFYVNANAVLYGRYCGELRTALLNVLRYINRADVTEEEKDRVNFVTDNMNNLQIYVDELAKAKWIGNNADRLEQVEQVRQQVANMYMQRRVEWCNDIMDTVAAWFE